MWVAFLLSASGCASTFIEAGPTISSLDAHDFGAQGQLLVIDIRPENERRQDGAPANAFVVEYPAGVLADHGEFIRDVDRITHGNRRMPVALLCRRGVTSLRAQAILRAAGYTTVYSVSDGFLGSESGPGWKAWGLPVVVPTARP